MIAATYFIDTSAVVRLARAGLYAALVILGVALAMVAAPVVVALAAVVLPVVAKLAAGLAIVAAFGWVTYPRPRSLYRQPKSL